MVLPHWVSCECFSVGNIIPAKASEYLYWLPVAGHLRRSPFLHAFWCHFLSCLWESFLPCTSFSFRVVHLIGYIEGKDALWKAYSSQRNLFWMQDDFASKHHYSVEFPNYELLLGGFMKTAYIWWWLLPCRTRLRSALMMSNAQFLFVARSYINIKRLRERQRGHGACIWCMTVNGQINVSSLARRKHTILLSLNLVFRLLLLILCESNHSQWEYCAWKELRLMMWLSDGVTYGYTTE